MRAQIRSMGNSSGIIIPKPILSQLGISAGDEFNLSLEEGRIVLSPAKRHVRAGWAEASKKLLKVVMTPLYGPSSLIWAMTRWNGEGRVCRCQAW